jgi:hypothetical protein
MEKPRFKKADYEDDSSSKGKYRAAFDAAIDAPMSMAKRATSKVKEFADSEDGKKLKEAAKFAFETSPIGAGSRPARDAAEYGIEKLKDAAASSKRDSGENTNPAGDTFKRGGKVSSASKRADGIAQKGKTRGKYL